MRGTSRWMSMRSSSGPLIRFWMRVLPGYGRMTSS
jgi:hypothetical protein